MNYYRKTVVDIMVSWIGKKESDGSFKSIVDIYNTIKPIPRGYICPYSTPWCAITVSAAFHKAGYDAIFTPECSCSKIIELAKSKGIWVENDAYVPQPGDCIIYDWDDSGKGDNKNNPDHIGMVEKVEGQTITIIEGNYSDMVKRRKIAVNSRYIRGYVAPKFTAYSAPTSKPATSKPATNSAEPSLKFKSGDIVEFTGNKHYQSSSGITGYACKPGKAKITLTNKGNYPYHCVATDDSKSTVYGWVSANDVKALSQPKEVKASAYAGKGPDKSLSGAYKVTATNGTAIRDNAGANRKALVTIPKNTTVQCYGYYSLVSSKKWLYVQATYNGVKYTGFVDSSALKKS
jgi:hypothetical protein